MSDNQEKSTLRWVVEIITFIGVLIGIVGGISESLGYPVFSGLITEKPDCYVPDLVGETRSRATFKMEEMEVEYIIYEVYDREEALGTVVDQMPPSGELLDHCTGRIYVEISAEKPSGPQTGTYAGTPSKPVDPTSSSGDSNGWGLLLAVVGIGWFIWKFADYLF